MLEEILEEAVLRGDKVQFLEQPSCKQCPRFSIKITPNIASDLGSKDQFWSQPIRLHAGSNVTLAFSGHPEREI